ncbi:RYamide receptor isoform X2 [Belonocnema kinseyi]|uniref:RYamide receptor isoform X2 n=1 Tax=Belonocnema kinseyi TaxID=2817044 RepID=UPI00143D048E|nr:RYamide receptor isoform X2 [Belonocnema kinseyi]
METTISIITEANITEINSDEENLTNYSCDELFNSGSVLSRTWFQTTIYILYTTVFVVALVGNVLVVYIVHSCPRMKTVTNYFIVNLAVGDILMDLFCVPTTFVSTLILQYWPFGQELCPSVNYSQAVSVLVSAYTLVAISIDRFMAIMWPLRPRLSKTQAKLLILAVWLLALIVSFPIALVSKLNQPHPRYNVCDRYMCEEIWPSTQQKYYYSIALLVLQYLVPLLVLMFTYTRIAIMVWGKRPPGEAENTRDQRMVRSKRKMVKMMVTVVIVFTTCWLPFNVLILVMESNQDLSGRPGFPFLFVALHWLAMSHACYNPVIYCWMNPRFRTGFLAALSRFPGVSHCVPDVEQRVYTSTAGIPLTGFDGQNHSGLRRMNTCTTYVSMRRKINGSESAVARSASFRYNDSLQPTYQQTQRHFRNLQSQPEEQI